MSTSRHYTRYMMPMGFKSEHILRTPGGSTITIRAIPPNEIEMEEMRSEADRTYHGPAFKTLDFITEAMYMIEHDSEHWNETKH